MGGELLIIVPAINYLKGGEKDMKRMTFRKSFLLSGILLFSVLVLGQSAWACETPDYSDFQCYEQLDIKRIVLDYDNNLIYIFGKNFNNGSSPIVTLGDDDLILKRYNENEIVTTFPGVEAGHYKLVVSTGGGYKCKDKQSVTIAHDNKPSCPPTPPPPTCPQECKGGKGDKGDKGDPGPAGPAGNDGQDGAPGLPGADGKNGNDGARGAQGPGGPQGNPGTNGTNGANGLPGISNYERIAERYTFLPRDTSTTYAICPTGKTLLGGGGGITDAYFALVPTIAKPVMIYNGPTPTGEEWNIIWFNPTEDDRIVNIVVYAICANVSQ
jgi:hypothetical protein